MKTILSNPSFTGTPGGRNLKGVWLFMLAVWVATIHISAVEARAQGASCYAHTVNGDVQGSDLGASCAFLGVPFAASTADSNRWKPPQPAAPSTLINATTPPASWEGSPRPRPRLAFVCGGDYEMVPSRAPSSLMLNESRATPFQPR